MTRINKRVTLELRKENKIEKLTSLLIYYARTHARLLQVKLINMLADSEEPAEPSSSYHNQNCCSTSENLRLEIQNILIKLEQFIIRLLGEPALYTNTVFCLGAYN